MTGIEEKYRGLTCIMDDVFEALRVRCQGCGIALYSTLGKRKDGPATFQGVFVQCYAKKKYTGKGMDFVYQILCGRCVRDRLRKSKKRGKR